MLESADRQFPGAVWSFSIGWGCDKLITAADLAPVRSALAAAHANGTTAFNASGDLAGLECKGGQDWSSPPSDADIGLDSVASLPEMTDVGGTTLSTDAAGVWQSEQAWFDVPLSLGSGGGVSALFDRPEWQRAVMPDQDPSAGSPPTSPRSPTSSPGVKIVFNGKQLVGGGTSQSAPIWAGLAAVMNQYLVANGGRRLGDFNPLLYTGRRGLPAAGLPRRDPRRKRGRRRGARLRPGDRPRHTRRRQPRPQHPHPAEGDRVTTPDEDAPATMECRVCQTDVPAGEFCGLCGDFLTEQRGNGPSWLRLRAYGADPGEHLLRPSLASSLFPQLPHRSRRPFQLALVLVLLALVTFATLRMPAALISVASLGLPLLFLLYMRETNVFRDVPRRTLLLTTALGIGLGIGWVLLTGAIVARSYGVPLGAGIAAGRIAREGLGIPVGSMVLMLVPAVVVRLLRPPTRESMDGFMIGALGALAFTAAATLTRLAPQFATGMVARARPVSSLIVEAGIRGVAVPLTAACVGGLIGAALWFTRPPNKVHQHASFVRAALAGFAAAVLAVYAALGLVDVAHIPQILQLAIHLTVAAVALLLLRLGLHLALLHEAHDEIQSDEPVLCPHCNHVVPDMAFCPACGVATHASSRFSRKERRQTRPTRAGADAPDGDHAPRLFDDRREPTPHRRCTGRRMSGCCGPGASPSSWWRSPSSGCRWSSTSRPARYVCPPDCGHPPTGEPVAVNPRFTAPDGTFSVSYPAPSPAYKITTSPNGIRADFLGGDGGTMQLMSRPANGRTPEQIAKSLVKETFPDTKTAYEIPNAMVGYVPGYGLVADCWPQGANSNYMRMRVMVMVAVKNDLALIAAAVGPFRQFGPDFGLGKPSGANLQLALDMGKYVNSFSWRGDPPR